MYENSLCSLTEVISQSLSWNSKFRIWNSQLNIWSINWSWKLRMI